MRIIEGGAMRRFSSTKITTIIAFAAAITAAAITMVAAACGGGNETNPQKLIPAGSNLIGQVNVSGILASGGLATIFEAIPKGEDDPQTLDDVLDKATEEIGIDIRKISQIALFGDMARTSEFFGIIAQGKFDELALISSIRGANDSPIVSTEYKGRLLYSPDDDPEEFTLAVLDQQFLVVGTREAVQAVIDVQDGVGERVSGPILDTFDDLGLGLFRLAFDMTEGDFLDRIPAVGEIPFLGGSIDEMPGALAALQDVRFVGLALAQNGQIMVLRANVDFAQEDSAAALGSLLDGLLKVAAGINPDEQVGDVLDRVEINHEGSRLSIRLEVAASELGALVSSVVGISSSERSTAILRPAEPRGIELRAEIPIMPTSNHVPQGQIVDYNSVPPASGDHWDDWAACGFYEDGLPDELITHNLEHSNSGKPWPTLTWLRFGGLPGTTAKYPRARSAMAAWGRLYTLSPDNTDVMAHFFRSFAGNLGPERIPC